jgi:hypothetical protein
MLPYTLVYFVLWIINFIKILLGGVVWQTKSQKIKRWILLVLLLHFIQTLERLKAAHKKLVIKLIKVL